VSDKGNQAIKVFLAIIKKRIEAHPMKEHKNVAEEDGEWMTHEQVGEALALADVQKLGLGHYGKGADMRAPKLGVVIVMVIVRASPDGARAQDEDPKKFHEFLRQAGTREDGVMLLIVIDDEKPKHEQPGQNAANQLSDGMKIPKCAHERSQQQRGGGNNVPPTSQWCVRGIMPGSFN